VTRLSGFTSAVGSSNRNKKSEVQTPLIVPAAMDSVVGAAAGVARRHSMANSLALNQAWSLAVTESSRPRF
jgi:hypothetical protein